MSDSNTSVAMEFVIGVTGHRDLVASEEAAIRSEITHLLIKTRQRFSNASLRVVTGLAAGADSLVAEVALDAGIAVSAILPMPREIYAQDFKGKELDRFNRLADDSRVAVHELPVSEGLSTDQLSDQEHRDRQYERLQDYLVRRSNMLVALWDGKQTQLPGGTGEVVLGYLGSGEPGLRPAHIPFDPAVTSDGADIVAWIPVSRACDPNYKPAEKPGYLVSNSNSDCYWQQPDLPEHITGRWRGFDAYVGDKNAGMGSDLGAWGLTPKEDGCSADAKSVDAEFIRADQMAQANQKQSDLMFKLFGLLAAGMGLFFLVYAKLYASKILLGLYVALFVAGYFGFKISDSKHWLGKHLSYRALAETLRVQFFLIVSGAGEGYNIRRILKLSSVDRFERFEWLQDAVRCCEPLVYSGHATSDRSIKIAREGWIEDQAKYFRKKHHQMHVQHERLEKVRTLLLFGSVLGALALIFLYYDLKHMEVMGFDGKSWLVFLMGLLPLWVAIWELYQGKMATRELIWQYANQERYFAAAARQIGVSGNVAAAKRVIVDLADKALIEIYLWSVHRYHREHEPPAAG